MAIRFGPSAATRCAPRSSTPPWCTTIAPRSSAPTPGACGWTHHQLGGGGGWCGDLICAGRPPSHHYGLILLDTLLVTLFVWIEARRYRYYELWSHRVRLMETDFFAAMLVPPFAPSPDWAESLAESLLQPDFPISMWRRSGAAIAATICGSSSFCWLPGCSSHFCIRCRPPAGRSSCSAPQSAPSPAG
ncbi:hypothetical protein EMGBS3_12690 [Anaerolineaceae bacterium]|nr:hypothetical protein EMGBS3_12690 [Anaerolineaceae bacterium]